MSLLSKSISERVYFDQFRILFEDFPKGKIVQGESPDFRIQINPRNTIGIEITRYIINNVFDKEIMIVPNSILNGEKLNKLILNKEEKAAFYRKEILTRLWLLIVVDSLASENIIHLPQSIEKWLLDTSFDKIFILQVTENKLFILK